MICMCVFNTFQNGIDNEQEDNEHGKCECQSNGERLKMANAFEVNSHVCSVHMHMHA